MIQGVNTTDKHLATPKKLKKEDPESKKGSNKKTSPNKRLIKEEDSPVEPKKRRTPAKTKTELNVTGNEMSPSAKKGKSPMKPKIDLSVPVEQEEAHIKPENAVAPTSKQEHKRDKTDHETAKETKLAGSSKSKGTALAKSTKNTSDTDEEGATTPTVVPVTPKGKKPIKKAKTPNEEDGSPVGRKRSVTKTAAAEARPIPTRLEHASPEDRKLVAMRDAGESWNDIRKMWKDMTGNETAHSTLPGRYRRLKENLIRLEEGDVCFFCISSSISFIST